MYIPSASLPQSLLVDDHHGNDLSDRSVAVDMKEVLHLRGAGQSLGAVRSLDGIDAIALTDLRQGETVVVGAVESIKIHLCQDNLNKGITQKQETCLG